MIFKWEGRGKNEKEGAGKKVSGRKDRKENKKAKENLVKGKNEYIYIYIYIYSHTYRGKITL